MLLLPPRPTEPRPPMTRKTKMLSTFPAAATPIWMTRLSGRGSAAASWDPLPPVRHAAGEDGAVVGAAGRRLKPTAAARTVVVGQAGDAAGAEGGVGAAGLKPRVQHQQARAVLVLGRKLRRMSRRRTARRRRTGCRWLGPARVRRGRGRARWPLGQRLEGQLVRCRWGPGARALRLGLRRQLGDL